MIDPILHPPPIPRLLEVPEVAYVLRGSEEMVRRLIRDGKLTAVRYGLRSWRVDPADLKTYIASLKTSNGNGNGHGPRVPEEGAGA